MSAGFVVNNNYRYVHYNDFEYIESDANYKLLEEHLTCPLCLSAVFPGNLLVAHRMRTGSYIATDPDLTGCSQIYCTRCAYKIWLHSSRQPEERVFTCLSCQTLVTGQQNEAQNVLVTASSIELTTMLELRVRCTTHRPDQPDEICGEVMTTKEFMTHSQQCYNLQ